MEEELAFYKSIVQKSRDRAHRNYQLNREEILAKRQVEYKLKHPEPRRRGRPPLAKNLCDAVPKTDCQ